MKKFALIPLLFILTACASSTTQHVTAPNLDGSIASGHEIQGHVKKAQLDINDVLKSQSKLLQVSATLKLRDANMELEQANATIDSQRLDLQGKQKQIDDQATKYNHLADDRDYWKRTADNGKIWAWRWAGAFFGLLGIVIALRIFRTYLLTVPVIGPLLSSIL